MKIDINSVKVTNDIENDNAKMFTKRKRLINLRENIPLKSFTDNQTIPKKLLVELASLPNTKFRIEIKSKHQSLVLPLVFKNGSNKVDVENLNLVTFNDIEKNELKQDRMSTDNKKNLDKEAILMDSDVSPLENGSLLLNK